MKIRVCDLPRDDAEELFANKFKRAWNTAEDELATWFYSPLESFDGGEEGGEPSPLPWICKFDAEHGVNSVIAANGAVIVPHTGYAANARLIVDAVNERYKLRNLVRSMANLATCLLRIYEDTYNDEQGREFARCERGMIRDALRQIEGGAK
jgi:hypothetical protein